MSHRRRSADFSHLLESFCDSTDCRTDLNVQRGSDKNRVDEKTEDNSDTCSYKSTILAGNAVDARSQGSTENSYRTASSGSTLNRPIQDDATDESCRSEVPSIMNRAIDFHFVPHSDLDLTQSREEPATGDHSNGKIETSEASSRDSRDTNYNIKNSSEIAPSSDARSRCCRADTPIYGSPAGSSTTRKDSSDILKRLTQQFISSPRRFTERLVTIINESESGYDNDENSVFDFSCMTKEFQKMCKYIQDESMPEHMNSTLGVSKKFEESKHAMMRVPETIEESPVELSSRYADAGTPDTQDVARRVYRKTPLNLFKKNTRSNQDADSPGSPNSTRQFVYLEKYLSDQQMTSPHAGSSRATLQDPPSSDVSEHLRNKMKIVQKSEQQLASLDDTCSRGFETFDSHPAHGAQERDIYDPRDDIDARETADGAIDEDELSMSLRLELEKQRERCFETARQMQKIEEDALACNEDYTKVLERYGIDPETECRKTINSLLTYQNCRAKIRQYDSVRRNATSSIDSGIDTRSISRTLLHASDKKSSNNRATSRNEGNTISSRSNAIKVGSVLGKTNSEQRQLAACNLYSRKTKNLPVAARKTSPGKLCTTTKALGRSRSRGTEKPSQLRLPETKTRTPTILRVNENRTNFFTLKGPVEQPDIPEAHSTPVSSSKEMPASTEKNRTDVRVGTKSPCLRYPVPSPRTTPTVRQSSNDRLARMITLGSAKSPSSAKIAKSPRNRFFVTPGKNVPVKEPKRRSKTFFPGMNFDLQPEGSQRIIKSPHAPGIYRRGMCTVISPLSMYIRGTDTNLIQNVQPKTNEMLLTPTKATAATEKLKFQLAAKTASPRASPRGTPTFNRKKDVESHSDDEENTEETDFVLPKVNYELPARVHTVDQNPKKVGGDRVRGLLRSMENRVVVRHEGRIFGKQDERDVPESGSDSFDMSIHVQRSAIKTNYLNRRK